MKHKVLKISAVLFLSLCLAGGLAFSAAPADNSYAATAKKNLISRKALTLTTGSKKRICIKNPTKKVRWTTSNKKIIRLKNVHGKRGRIVTLVAGKKTGKCTIKARIGKKTLSCKVRVKKPSSIIIPDPGEEDRKIETRPISSGSVDLAASLKPSSTAVSYSDEFTPAALDFSMNLLHQTRSLDTKSKNLFISPDSVMTALGMLELGAGSDTLSEMESMLGSGMKVDVYNASLSALNARLSAGKKPIYEIANSIWARKGSMDIKQSFLQANADYHQAAFYEADFDAQTCTDINNWVYNKTRNMIDKIIDQLDKDTRLILINCVAFEGKWNEPFVAACTQKEDFTNADGSKTTVDMMNQTETTSYLKLADGYGFAKYYQADGDNHIAFVALLPKVGTSVRDYMASITGESFATAWKNRTSARIDMKVPKFSTDYSVSLVGPLQAMGMKKAFTNDADFYGIIEPSEQTEGLKVDEVLHKTHFEIDEKGSKAAAVTAIITKATSAHPSDPPIPVYLDRPFVYALVDCNTGIPLFIGAQEEM